ncbi:MAG: ROK family protein [Cyclobacteriaceae bacterium]|nr:ROK family protein [Cyclobacteriaceae bacterium]
MTNTIGIDLGGTVIKIGLVQDGVLTDRREMAAQSASGLKSQLPDLERNIHAMLKSNQLVQKDLLGIGFSFAGLVDSRANRIISTNQKYDDGPDIDLVAWAKNNWDCPLFAENDARVALLGEWQHGIGRGWENIVMVTLGTGIGSGVLIEGRLLRGKHFQAGNLSGHFTVNHRGGKCTCGNIGCMEAETSTWKLPDLIRSHLGFGTSTLQKENTLDFEALFRHAASGDLVATEVLDHCFSVWSAGIITMIHAFDPEVIILSGGIMKSAPVIIPQLQTRISEYAWTPWGKVQILVAQNINDAALYGADYLVRSQLN